MAHLCVGSRQAESVVASCVPPDSWTGWTASCRQWAAEAVETQAHYFFNFCLSCRSIYLLFLLEWGTETQAHNICFNFYFANMFTSYFHQQWGYRNTDTKYFFPSLLIILQIHLPPIFPAVGYRDTGTRYFSNFCLLCRSICHLFPLQWCTETQAHNISLTFDYFADPFISYFP